MNLIEIKQQTEIFYLTWIINNICTNKCSYCPPNLHNGTNHNYDWKHAERFAAFLIEKHSKINLAISGGEPTLSPWFRDLVKMFSDAGHSVGMTTNGARSVRYFNDIAQYMSYIVISYHPSSEDPELIEKALACSKYAETTVSVMFDSRYFDKCLEFYNKIKNYRSISVQPVKILGWIEDSMLGREYTDEQLKLLEKLPQIYFKIPTVPKNLPPPLPIFIFDNNKQNNKIQAQLLINEEKTNFIGWDCDMGISSLVVRPDGSISTANCSTAETIGNIQEFDNIKWPTTSYICKQTACICTTDVYLSKKKSS
jgi:MoaA/NifB/PqqE/SkfB family radical SAM enzyme